MQKSDKILYKLCAFFANPATIVFSMHKVLKKQKVLCEYVAMLFVTQSNWNYYSQVMASVKLL